MPVPDPIAQAIQLATTLGPPSEFGAREGPALDEAARLILAHAGALPDEVRVPCARILWRTAHYAEAQAIGTMRELAMLAAETPSGRGLLDQLAKVETDDDRAFALAAQRRWAAALEQPGVDLSSPARPGGATRIGVLSSDLKHHVVGYFVQPVFEFIPEDVELFIYADAPPPSNDPAAQWFANRAKGHRVLPPSDEAAAQMIARDELDLLIEIGGPTTSNRPGVVAYRPARTQASWLGYPQSLGLSTIDCLVADPRFAPARPDLLCEPTLNLRSSYICMAPSAFPEDDFPLMLPPCVINGYVTFGTANDVYKLNPRVLAAWGEILRQTPGSRLMFIRPEAGAETFQRNMATIFAGHGVEPDRLIFRGVRGGVRPLYGEMDIALDTFPVTGGTTTCDAIWMGVSVVSLVGPALYERMRFSILGGIGLEQLVAPDVDGYIGRAVELAGRPDLLSWFRENLRGRIRGAPIGQPLQFAFDFYTAIMDLAASR